MIRTLLKRAATAASTRTRRSGAIQTALLRGGSINASHLVAFNRRAVRGFASSSAGNAESSHAHDLLKRDFRRWVGKEVQLLVAMIVIGVTGVHFYQNREGGPSRQIATLLDKARANAKKADREGALQNCLKAYAIAKSTNPQDRHLFELAFLVAAQFETLGKAHQATKFYLDALSSVPYVKNSVERDVGRVVVLDRIAQCYQDQGEQRAAENYYRQAVEAYDKSARSSSSLPVAAATDGLQQIDREIAVVLFNYGQQLVHLKRWDDATRVLQRAQSLAKAVDLGEDEKLRIDRLLLVLQQSQEPQDETNVEEEET